MASPPKAGIWLKRSSVAQCHLLWEGARVAVCKGDCPWIAAGGCGAGMGILPRSLWGGLGGGAGAAGMGALFRSLWGGLGGGGWAVFSISLTLLIHLAQAPAWPLDR